MYVEYKDKKRTDDYWSSYGARINPGRNYFLFGILSKGVRAEPEFSFEPKGSPDNMGYHSKDDAWMYICESEGDNYVTLEQAKKYEGYGCKIINDNQGKPTWVEHPDWHSHSWLTVDEFQQAMEYYRKEAVQYPEPEYEALLASMQKLSEFNKEVRVVFWFDN